MSRPAGVPAAARRLPVWALILVIVVYLGIVQGTSRLLTRNLDLEYAAPTSMNELWRQITVAVFASLVFVYAVVAVLRWWRPVFVDDRPTRRWVRVLPITMVVVVLAGTNWAGLGERGAAFSLVLLGSALMVGFAEEGMFRGIAVTTFRVNGFPETKVALWSTLLFGLAHATNIVSEGASAFVQVLVTIVAGYFFYLIRRWSGGLVVPAVLHGLWDFGLISGSVVPGTLYLPSLLFMLADVVMLVVVLRHRHRIDPVAAPETSLA